MSDDYKKPVNAGAERAREEQMDAVMDVHMCCDNRENGAERVFWRDREAFSFQPPVFIFASSLEVEKMNTPPPRWDGLRNSELRRNAISKP